MTDRACRVSIVICAYTADRWPELIAALDSVRQQSRPPQEIILVIENRRPRGLSGARNSGLARASVIIGDQLRTTLGFLSGRIQQGLFARQAEERPDQTASGVIQ